MEGLGYADCRVWSAVDIRVLHIHDVRAGRAASLGSRLKYTHKNQAGAPACYFSGRRRRDSRSLVEAEDAMSKGRVEGRRRLVLEYVKRTTVRDGG